MDGVVFRRAAFLIGAKLVVFLDLIGTEDASAHKLDIACHLRGAWLPVPPGENVTPPDKPGYLHLRDLRAVKAAPGLTFAVAAPGGSTTVVAFAPVPGAPATFWTGTGVGVNTEDRVPVIIARRQAAATAFAWAIAINPARRGDAVANPADAPPAICVVPVTSQKSGAPVPSDEAAAALVKSTGGTFLVIANPAGRSIKAGSWAGTDKLLVVKQ